MHSTQKYKLKVRLLFQNFRDSWKSGKWEEKFEIAECQDTFLYRFVMIYIQSC